MEAMIVDDDLLLKQSQKLEEKEKAKEVEAQYQKVLLLLAKEEKKIHEEFEKKITTNRNECERVKGRYETAKKELEHIQENIKSGTWYSLNENFSNMIGEPTIYILDTHRNCEKKQNEVNMLKSSAEATVKEINKENEEMFKKHKKNIEELIKKKELLDQEFQSILDTSMVEDDFQLIKYESDLRKLDEERLSCDQNYNKKSLQNTRNLLSLKAKMRKLEQEEDEFKKGTRSEYSDVLNNIAQDLNIPVVSEEVEGALKPIWKLQKEKKDLDSDFDELTQLKESKLQELEQKRLTAKARYDEHCYDVIKTDVTLSFNKNLKLLESLTNDAERNGTYERIAAETQGIIVDLQQSKEVINKRFKVAVEPKQNELDSLVKRCEELEKDILEMNSQKSQVDTSSPLKTEIERRIILKDKANALDNYKRMKFKKQLEVESFIKNKTEARTTELKGIDFQITAWTEQLNLLREKNDALLIQNQETVFMETEESIPKNIYDADTLHVPTSKEPSLEVNPMDMVESVLKQDSTASQSSTGSNESIKKQLKSLVEKLKTKKQINEENKLYNQASLTGVETLRNQHAAQLVKILKKEGTVSSLKKTNRPQPGDVYLYRGQVLDELKECDGEIWKTGGYTESKLLEDTPSKCRRYISKANPNFLKAIYHCKTDNYTIAHYYMKRVHRKPLPDPDRLEETDDPFLKVPTETLKKVVAPEDKLTRFKATAQDMADYPITKKMALQMIHEAVDLNTPLPANSAVIQWPKSGEIYIFQLNCNTFNNSFSVIHNDGHRWLKVTQKNEEALSMSQTNLPRHHYQYRRMDRKVDARFTKNIYVTPNEQFALIHYNGDEKVVQNEPNYKEKPRYEFIKSTVESLDGTGAVKPAKLLQELTLSTDSEGITKTLTDASLRQVRRLQQKFRNASKLQDNEIANLTHLHNLMKDDYIRYANTIPSIQVTVANTKNVEEFRNVLRTMDREEFLRMQYDTTYEMGNRYVSTLSYRIPTLDRKVPVKDATCLHPIVPLVSLIHETRSLDDHELFLSRCSKILGEKDFQNQNKLFISDEEFKDIVKWQNTEQFYCWNHQKQNIHRKAADGLKMGAADVEAVNEDVQRFLMHSSLENYIQDKNETFRTATHWNTNKGLQLQKYFDRNKQETFKKIGRWRLQELGIEGVEKGLTNNAAETLNSQFAQFKTSRRDASTIDDLVLELFYFEKMIGHQIEAGYHNEGPFKVKDRFKHLAKDPSNLPSSFEFNPQVIRNQVKEILEAKQTADSEMPPKVSTSDESVTSKVAREIVEQNLFSLAYVDGSTICTVKLNNETFAANITNRTCSCKDPSCCSHLLAGLVVTGHRSDFSLPSKKATKEVKTTLKVPGKRSIIHGSKKPMAHDLISSAIKPKGIVPMKNVPPLNKTVSFSVPNMEIETEELKRAMEESLRDHTQQEVEDLFQSVVRVSSNESDVMPPKQLAPLHATPLHEFNKEMNEGDIEYIETNGQLFALKVTSPGHLVIVTNDKELPTRDYYKEIDKVANNCIANSAVFNSSHNMYQVKTAILSTKKNIKEKCEELTDTKSLDRYWHSTSFHCKCGKMISKGADSMKCLDCEKYFHKECVQENRCDPCKSDVKGLQWSAGLYFNTCTIDNHLTVVAHHTRNEDPHFITHFTNKKASKEEKKFGEAALLTKENKSAEAQNLYGIFITKRLQNENPRDLEGSVSHATIDQFTNSFMSTSTCEGIEGKKCRRPTKRIDRRDIYLNKASTVNESIEDSLKERMELCDFCTKVCKDKSQLPMRTVGKVQMKDFTNPPAFLTFNNMQTNFTANQLREAKTVININGQTYKKKMIVMHNNSPNHFNTLFESKEQWYSYDGMKTPHLRYANDLDFQNDKNNLTAESITYFHHGPMQ